MDLRGGARRRAGAHAFISNCVFCGPALFYVPGFRGEHGNLSSSHSRSHETLIEHTLRATVATEAGVHSKCTPKAVRVARESSRVPGRVLLMEQKPTPLPLSAAGLLLLFG